MHRSSRSDEVPFKEQNWVRGAKLLVDIIALQVSLYLGWHLRAFLTRWVPLDLSQQDYAKLAIGLLLLPVGFWMVRLYPGYGLTTVERLRSRLRTTFIFFMVFITWNFLAHESGRSRGVLLITLCSGLRSPTVFSIGVAQDTDQSRSVGYAGHRPRRRQDRGACRNSLLKDDVLGYRPIAIFDDDRKKWGLSIAGVPVVGSLEKADEYSGKVDCALIAIPGAGRERVVGSGAPSAVFQCDHCA